MRRLHQDELEVSDDLVRDLVARQLPGLAGRRLTRLPAAGSSNVLYRLGADLLVRFPRQPGGSDTIDKEAGYLPLLAPALPVALPRIVAVGEPGLGYPERWSVFRWIAGQRPAVPVSGPAADRLARDLAGTLSALHELPVPPAARLDPALNWYRAGPLRAIDADIRRYLADCRSIPDLPLDLAAGVRFWDAAMTLPDPSGRPRWIHTDLVAENLLLADGRLAAVLDFGGLALGHPSVDLIAGWELFGAADREVFRSAMAVDALDWARGRAWAFAIAVMTFPYYWHTMPTRCAHRLVMATAVLDDYAGNP
jgi:aminoglycoside phosphotransferase (APT) family kinase protein